MAAARSYLGVRWHHLGRTRDGVDCVGLLLLAARDCGMQAPDPPTYAKGYRGPEMTAALGVIGRRVSPNERRVGDVLAFRDVRFCAHVGVLTARHGAEYVVHARADLRQVVEQPLTGRLLHELAVVIRPPEFED